MTQIDHHAKSTFASNAGSNVERAADTTPGCDVSVVIPHYDDLANLDRCLTLLGRQSSGGNYEIVVADNKTPAGIDAVRQVVGQRARVIEVEERGAGPARNAGVRASRGEILAFIDSDCRPDPLWLSEGVATLGMREIVGGRISVTVADPAEPTAVEAYEQVFAFRNEDYIRRKGFAVTASLFVRRAVFDEVGPFDNGVSEDVEWCARARGLGVELRYVPSARLDHPARRSWDELTRKWRRLTRETYFLNANRPLGRLRWLIRSWLVLLSAPLHGLQVFSERDLPSMRARFGALSTLFRIRAFRLVEAHRVAFEGASPKGAS